MALTYTNLTTGGDIADVTEPATYATASITATANRLVLIGIMMASTAATVPSAASVTGGGLTWVEVGAAGGLLYNADKRRLQVFRALGAAPSAGALTIALSPALSTTIGCMWSVIESSADVDTTGTNGSGAIVQSASNFSGSATSLIVTLAAFGDATNNAAVGFFGSNANNTWTPGVGFTELGDAGQDSPTLSITSEYQTGQDLSVDATSAGAANPIGGFALETKYALAGGAAGQPMRLRRRDGLVIPQQTGVKRG